MGRDRAAARGGRQPSARETALAEAIGFGDMGALEALDPTPAELASRLPGDTSPLRVAVVTDRPGSVRRMPDRPPPLARQRFQPFGGTVLHLAVEWDRRAIAAIAPGHGADLGARDHTHGSTACDWAGHFGRTELAALFDA